MCIRTERCSKSQLFHYNTLKRTIDDLMDEEDMDWQEAMQMALKKRHFLFQKLIQDYESEEESDEED